LTTDDENEVVRDGKLVFFEVGEKWAPFVVEEMFLVGDVDLVVLRSVD
jgi:hypothetical protein